MINMDVIKVKVKLKTKDMYAYMMYNSYSAVVGACLMVASIVIFAFLCILYQTLSVEQRMILLIASIAFPIGNPVLMYIRAAKQISANHLYRHPLKYYFSKEGFEVRQGKQKLKVDWNHVTRVSNTPKYIYIYTPALSVSILPKISFKNKIKELYNLIEDSLDGQNIKIPKEIKRKQMI